MHKSGGEAIYSTITWLLKDWQFSSNEFTDCIKLLSCSSSLPFIQDLFAQKLQCTKDELCVFIKFLNSGSSNNNNYSVQKPHFIKCFIPNRGREVEGFENSIVIDQLRYHEIIDGIRMYCIFGYAKHFTCEEFVARYTLLAKQEDMENEVTIKGKRNVIIKVLELEETKQYKIGETMVFLKKSTYEKLEELREAKLLSQ